MSWLLLVQHRAQEEKQDTPGVVAVSEFWVAVFVFVFCFCHYRVVSCLWFYRQPPSYLCAFITSSAGVDGGSKGLLLVAQIGGCMSLPLPWPSPPPSSLAPSAFRPWHQPATARGPRPAAQSLSRVYGESFSRALKGKRPRRVNKGLAHCVTWRSSVVGWDS